MVLFNQLNGERVLNRNSLPSADKTDVKVKEETSTTASTQILPSDALRDQIDNFDSFVVMLASAGDDAPWKEYWHTFEQHDGICFYRLSRDDYFNNVTISFKILISKTMNVVLYKNELQADRSELNWILRLSKLELWSQFHRMLEYYQTEPAIQANTNSVYQIECALETMNRILYNGDIDGVIAPIKQQLESTLDQLKHQVKKEAPDDDYETIETTPEFLSFDPVAFPPQWPDVKTEPIDDEILLSCTIEEPPPPKKHKKRKRNTSDSEDKTDAADEITKCEYCGKLFPTKALCRSHVYGSHVSSS